MLDGNVYIGPGFWKLGEMILYGRDMVSPSTWALAHEDQVGERSAM